MARLLMLSGSLTHGDGVENVIHPRSGKQIRKFGVRKVILWNDNGVVGGAMKLPLWSLDEDMGAYGVIEFYDGHDHAGGSSPTVGSDKPLIRIPVSGKSRLVLEFPGAGLIFKKGLLAKIGSEGSNNDSNKRIYYQLVGYEYAAS
jgi:hypothetical protein